MIAKKKKKNINIQYHKLSHMGYKIVHKYNTKIKFKNDINGQLVRRKLYNCC